MLSSLKPFQYLSIETKWNEGVNPYGTYFVVALLDKTDYLHGQWTCIACLIWVVLYELKQKTHPDCFGVEEFCYQFNLFSLLLFPCNEKINMQTYLLH